MPMTPDTKRLVDERLRARRRRSGRIRKRVLAAAGSTFVLAWGVIFVQLVSGHDPALAKRSTTSTSSRGSAATAGQSGTSSSGTSSGSSSSGSSSSGSTSPLTTSQS